MWRDKLKEAIQLVGGQGELSRKLGVSQPTVWYWVHRAKSFPADWVLPIEAATDGAVRRHDLRPDLFPKPEEAA